MQVHKLPFALCVVVDVDNTWLRKQYAIMRKRTSSLFLATTAKNVDDKALMRKRTSYPLAIVRKCTSY